MQTELLPTSPAPIPSRQDAQAYLDSIETLGHELETAMQAIAARELSTFEQSVSRQLALCARLTEASSRSVASLPEISSPVPVDAELAGRIKAATSALLTLNRRYSALLKHSGDTMRLFAGLFRSYSGQSRQAPGMRSHLHTWSCEL